MINQGHRALFFMQFEPRKRFASEFFKAAFVKYYESALVLDVAQKGEKSGQKSGFSNQNEEKSEKYCEKMKKSKKIRVKNSYIKESSNVGVSMLACLKNNYKG